MSLTLVEGAKYSNDVLKQGIIDYLVKDSPVLGMMPFEEIQGNGLTYNVVTTDSTASFYAVDDTWTESTPVLTQATAALRIMGGDVDLDEFIRRTRSNINDVKATLVENKTKAIQNLFLDTFYYGDDSSDVKTFDGLQVLLSNTTYNTVHAGTDTGSALSLAKLDEAIDMLKTTPDAILMSKKMYRLLAAYYRSIGEKLGQTAAPMFGGFPPTYGRYSTPIFVDEHIVDTETAASGAYAAKTGGDNTSIFIVSFSNMGVCGIQGDGGLQIKDVGELENKNAVRTRLVWYPGLKVENITYAAKVDGIAVGSAVTA